MPELNEEMRVTADYAITTAKERYGLELDYSEDSLLVLDKILEKIYWGFSSHAKDEGEDSLIYNAAIIWGSYLGEYMRLKWGGTWILKGTERRISITSIEFSPISLVYQKITYHPEYSVSNYIKETKNVIYTSVIHPKKSQYLSESTGQPSKEVAVKPVKKPIAINRRLIYITGGILGILIIIVASMAGYAIFTSGGLASFSLLAAATSTNTPSPTIYVTPTLAATDTPSPTVTELPTYTPKPSNTPRPTRTPYLSPTPTASLTPTETETPLPTDTEIPYRSPTPTEVPTREPTEPPTDTPVPPPPPPPPPSIDSCDVNPSSVDAGSPVAINFVVKFSAPGYQITGVNFIDSYPGQNGCSSSPAGGDGRASCEGSSGMLPSSTTVRVTISTSLGDCSASYGSK